MNILSRLVKDNTNPLTEGETKRQQRIKALKEQFPEPSLAEQLQRQRENKKYPHVKNVADTTLLTNETFVNKAQQGPLHTVDSSWTKNLDYLEKEIKETEKSFDRSKEKLEKSRNELKQIEHENTDYQKKLYALKDASIKLQALVPKEEKEQSTQEPQLLTETTKKVAKKKVAKKCVKTNE